MATGDQKDFLQRFINYLPRWFPDQSSAPVLYGILNGLAIGKVQVLALQAYVRLLTRLQTAVDGFLDLASMDFFGNGLPRKGGEQDPSFRARIMANLFPEKGTRNAMVKALTLLTGNAPIIFEPARPQDALCLGYGGLGYGRLGSYQMNNQAFVTVFLPKNSGGALVAGLGSTYAGLASPYLAMENAANLLNTTAYSDVYATIQATKPEGSTVWTRITT